MLRQLKKRIDNMLIRFFRMNAETDYRSYNQEAAPAVETYAASASDNFKNLKVSFYGDEASEMIGLEFFDESDGVVDISIQDSGGKIVYHLTMFTAPTLYININTSAWESDLYAIFLHYPDNNCIQGFLYHKMPLNTDVSFYLQSPIHQTFIYSETVRFPA